jgi:hypothetical protein
MFSNFTSNIQSPTTHQDKKMKFISQQPANVARGIMAPNVSQSASHLKQVTKRIQFGQAK